MADTTSSSPNFAFETNALYRNDGQGQFAVATQRLGLADPSYRPLGFGTKFFDYDNDGDLDLFAANGHVIDRIAEVDSSQTYRQPNQMFRNDAGRRFADVSATLGPDFQRANAGRATATADYDDDGDLDLLVTTVAAQPRLLRNDGGNASTGLQILLVGKEPPDALGASRVVATNPPSAERHRGGAICPATTPPALRVGRATAPKWKSTGQTGRIRYSKGRRQSSTQDRPARPLATQRPRLYLFVELTQALALGGQVIDRSLEDERRSS